MSSDPNWWKERAEALEEGDTWPRTRKQKQVEKKEIEVKKKITKTKK